MAMAMAMASSAYIDGWLKWWDGVGDSSAWQDGAYYGLSCAYAIVGTVALIQLIRIQWRVPEYGWTTQKVFHLMNFIVNTARVIVFGFHDEILTFRPKILGSALLDLPVLIYFSTYTLLVLFWAEIYHQANHLPTERLRPIFLGINGAIYFIQVAIWVYEWSCPGEVIAVSARLFLSVVSLIAAAGFITYGRKLFLVLRRFPIESKGRQKKLKEVGFVTAICFTCFLIRAVVMAYSAFQESANVDALNHPILNLFYYVLVEIVPSALVLFILRKLPPRRGSPQTVR